MLYIYVHFRYLFFIIRVQLRFNDNFLHRETNNREIHGMQEVG